MSFLLRIISPVLLLFFFILSTSTSFAQQTKKEGWKHLSCPEKKWVLSHPFIANTAFQCATLARQETQSIKTDKLLDDDEDGGRVDAFRHAYWMALLSQKIKTKKALKLGVAHERGNYKQFLKGKTEDTVLPDSVAGEMDLWNNKVGVSIGSQNKGVSPVVLKEKVIEAILTGEMKILLKNQSGIPLTCHGNIIDLTSYKGQWSIPKCLTSSNAKTNH